MTFTELKCDPCPRCGKEVTHFATAQDNELQSMLDDHSTQPPAEITLLPCGHEADSYRVDARSSTVEWKLEGPE